LDFLSLIQALKNSELSLLLPILNKLNIVIPELNYKISRLNINKVALRLIWCLAHIGIKNNEVVNRLAKDASNKGDLWNNNITSKEILAFLRAE